ncbi:RNHCP domain-containing protein [Actinocatenispora comari]|uniref:RNHCP domain-containing protein n=1 Tax=Actinocatenispora comari TaxID=2807577 RepID=UPI001A91C312|nr:RNHCP domain-containing protein [Actinocatenispora comari]
MATHRTNVKKKAAQNTGFRCVHCHAQIPPHTGGGFRNHCPHCLHSVHVDVLPGDRAADCGGLLVPIAVDYHSKKGYQLIHRCTRCGATRRNRTATNTHSPDNPDRLIALMAP